MAKHRAITLVVNLAMAPEADVEEVREQLQNFLVDLYRIEPPEHQQDPEWAPFDVNAVSVHTTRNEIIYVDEEEPEEEESQLPAWILDPGEA